MNKLGSTSGNSFGRQTNALARERLPFYLGCAIIDLKHLAFEEPLSHLGVRQFDSENVTRLISIFEIEGCCKLEPEHKIAAVIDSSAFADALSTTKITKEQLLDPATQIVLKLKAFGESSWLVDLYQDDLPVVTRAQIRENSLKSLEFPDGEIYRTYRIYKNAHNEFQAAKWWAKLGLDRRRTWFRLLEKKDRSF